MNPTTSSLLVLLKEYGVIRVKSCSDRYERIYRDFKSMSDFIVYEGVGEIVIVNSKVPFPHTYMV